MDKIASPQDLQNELRRLLAYSETEKPSRAKLASALRGLADRVAAAKMELLLKRRRQPGEWVEVLDFKDASRKVRSYIMEHDLGSSNWKGGLLVQYEKVIAEVTYNGRVWDLSGKEIKI